MYNAHNKNALMPHRADPKPVHQLLEHHSLRAILQKARQLSAASEVLAQVLPEALAPHCTLLNIRENTMVIASSDASWATRLRYIQSDILWHFCQIPEFSTITRIHIRLWVG